MDISHRKALEICQQLAKEFFKDSDFSKFTAREQQQNYIRSILLKAIKGRVESMERCLIDYTGKTDFISACKRKMTREWQIGNQNPEDSPFTNFDVYAFGAFISIMQLMAISGDLNEL